MIKKSKILIFTLITFVASILLSSNVFAFTKSDVFQGDYHDSTVKITSGLKYSGKYYNYKAWIHHTTLGGKKYDSYCIDPARYSGDKNTKLVVGRLFNQSKPKDAVLLYIMSASGYTRAEKEIAIRAFVPLINDLSTNTAWSNKDLFKKMAITNANSGIKWASEEAAATKKVFGISSASVSTLTKMSTMYEKYNSKNILNENKTEVKNARALFKKSLKAGAEIADGKKTTKKIVTYDKVKFSETVDEKDPKYSYNLKDNTATRELTFKITFNKFNDGTKEPVKITVNPDTNGVAKLDFVEYQVSGTDTWTRFDSNTDFKPLLDKDNVVIKFRLNATAPIAKKASFKINFKIDVDYVDENVLTGAYIYNKKASTPTQRFYVYDEEPNKHEPYSQVLVWDDTVGYCTYSDVDKDNTNEFKEFMTTCCRTNKDAGGFNIVTECQKAIDAAKTEEEKENVRKNNIYCKLKAEYCDYCNTKIEVPKTCSEFSEGEFEKDKEAKISGPEDIKVCVWDGVDETEQSYKLTKKVSLNGGKENYSFADNKYCNVSCKEDYAIGLPAGRYVISGRYFTLKMGVKATKTCYTDLINYDLFNSDIKDLGDKLGSYINSGSTSGANKEFANVLEEYNKAITDIKACSIGWDNKYNVDPEITFNYQEEYIDKLLGDDLKFVKQNDEKVTTSKWFCNANDVDKTFTQCLGATPTAEAQTTQIDGYKCTKNADGITYKCEKTNIEIPTTKYAKVATTVEASFTPESVFYTKYSTGVIDVKQGKNKKYTLLEEYLDSKIDDSIKIKSGGLPIQLKDNQGVYNYDIKFNNIGEYFDKAGAGRLVGGKDSVALVSGDTTFKGTYVCSYVVNCPECKTTCVEDPKLGIFCNIEKKSCPGGSCDVECVGTCAYDADHGELYSIHQTSLTNFNATGRTLGANLTTDKGEALIDSITNQGENIYKEPEYSFTFNAAAISFLRDEINAKSKDGYLGEADGYDMNCYLYSDLLDKTATTAEEKARAKEVKESNEDYTICQSSVLDKLATMDGVKVHPLEDSRSKLLAWKDSEYCKSGKYTCVLVGNVGPAWK